MPSHNNPKEMKLRQRTPGEMRAYFDGWCAAVKFVRDASKLSGTLESAVDRAEAAGIRLKGVNSRAKDT